VLYIVAIALDVAFELRKRMVEGVEAADPEKLIHAWKHFGEPLFVILGHLASVASRSSCKFPQSQYLRGLPRFAMGANERE